MKKIIKNKVYDTKTAQEVGSWSNGGTWRDFSHMQETLYRKKTGEYFLHGEGGPQTKYAESEGSNSWSGGERLIPLSFEAASAWAQEKLSGEEYEAIFGEVVEDDSKKLVAYSLTVTAIEKLKRLGEVQGRSASDILNELILNI